MNFDVSHIIAPPRSGKTTSCIERVSSFLSANPSKKVGYVSYSMQLSQYIVKQFNTESEDPQVRSYGTGSAMCSIGLDLVILDDLIPPEGQSCLQSERTYNWIKQSVICRLYPNAVVYSIASGELQTRMVVGAFAPYGVKVSTFEMGAPRPPLLQTKELDHLYTSNPQFQGTD